MFVGSLVLALAITALGDEWSIEVSSYEEGPRTVFEGYATLHQTEQWLVPCMTYTMDIPKGRLVGPPVSSDPGHPMLPFDVWQRTEAGLDLLWCEGPPQRNPLTDQRLQQLPVDIPRYFKFYVIKDTFAPDDITKLLAEWGETASVWDLNLDGTVDGLDLAIALGGWHDETEGTS